MNPRALLAGLVRVEQAMERQAGRFLRGRPGWHLTVTPYAGHASGRHAHARGRVVVRRRERTERTGRRGALLTSLARYLSVEAADEPVSVEVAGQQVAAVSGPEGYIEVEVDVAELEPGWHPVTFRVGDGSEPVEGRILAVAPDARLGLVSDIDDTVLQTGLTRAWEAIRTTMFVPETERVPLAGAAELYQGLVHGDAGRAPVFYVSTGAWNFYDMTDRFLARHGFPVGPLVMTDWGPGTDWLFREDSAAFKSRTISGLLADHPQLSWVLVGDAGQHDAAAYGAVARVHPDRIAAIYIRAVPPYSTTRAISVRRVADELAALGVPMLLVRDSVEAAEHAHRLGLLDDEHLAAVRAAVGR
ncbi:MAG: DUF2183 domain-containing protein [Actinomycetota bacterium]|nr:DUF2183 domain-containing protein [Actinomycetota bacterium]